MKKPNVWTSYDPGPSIARHGSGETFRMGISMTTHAGPVNVKGKASQLVLTAEDAKLLAMQIIGNLPFDCLKDDSDFKKRICTFAKMFALEPA
jgi:hypothetical protein